MMTPHPACRESMGRARQLRWLHKNACGGPKVCDIAESIPACRRETVETVRALRAARRTEGALIERWGVR